MGSKLTIFVNASLILVATFIFGGWATFFIAVMPFFAVPIALVAGTIVYGTFEVIGTLLQAVKRLSILNLLAIVSVLCIPLGFVPIGVYGNHPLPEEMLLEEFAISFLYYAFLLHLMCVIWWSSRDKEQIVSPKHLDRLDTLAVILLLAAPYYLFGVAQTSKLHAAVKSGEVEKVSAALKPWKSVDSYSRSAGTPLGIAIHNNDKEVARFLLDRGASIRIPRPNRIVIDHLEKAVRYRKLDLVELLAPYADDTSLTSALVAAVKQRDFDTINLLIDHGAKVENGESFYLATRQGNVDLIRLLLSRAQSPTTVADTGWRGLKHFHSKKNTRLKIEIAEILLAHGANIVMGRDLLEDTLRRRTPDIDFAKFLLEKGCPPSGSRRDYRTPLEHAVEHGRDDIVRLLLKHGADPNVGARNCSIEKRCTDRRTAMYHAAEGSEEIAAMLIAHGGDVILVNRQKDTPLDVAIRKKNSGVIELFKAASERQRRIKAEEIEARKRKEAELRQNVVPPNCVRRSIKGGGSYGMAPLVCNEKGGAS